MKFVLPIPPSINRTYGVTRKGKIPFYKKRIVRDWEDTAGWEIKKQWIGKKEMRIDPCIVTITWYLSRGRDIDAGIKVLLDLLQRQGVYKNDSQVVSLHVLKLEDKENPHALVEVEYAGD